MKISPSNILSVVITTLLVVIMIYRMVITYWDYLEINLNKEVTNGVVVDYYDVGIDNVFLEYEYNVYNKEYNKTIRVALGSGLGDCSVSKKCIGRKFVVYYSSKNPEKSEIDLDKEIE
jgi:hypothetical protein